MARPKTIHIDRKKVIDETIKILEHHGLEGFNLRKLAHNLAAHPSSVYHYFDGRASILSAAAGHVLREIEVPQPNDDWQEWAVDVTMNYWKTLARRPFVIPILLAGYEPATEVRARLGAMMDGVGIDLDRQVEINRAIEACVFGFVMEYAAKGAGDARAAEVKSDQTAAMLRKILTFIFAGLPDLNAAG